MIGTPFVSNVEVNGQTIFNNRVQVHHFGMSGAMGKLNYKALYAHALSLGNYSQPFPDALKANYLMLEITRPNVMAGFDIALSVSADIMPQTSNNYGAMLRLTKTGVLFKDKNAKVKNTLNDEGKLELKESVEEVKIKEAATQEVVK